MLSVLGALLLGGLALPLPEDLALFSAGYLVWRGDLPFHVLAPLCALSVVACDFTLYCIGKWCGHHPLVARRLRGPRLDGLTRSFAAHGVKFVLLARLAFGARSLFFLAAGLARMPFGRFLLTDLFGASVSTVVWIAIGFRFGAQLERARDLMGIAQIVVAALLAVPFLWFLRKWITDVASRFPGRKRAETDEG